MSSTTYVLLPPSESKEPGGHFDSAPGFFDESLSSPRDRVRQAIGALLESAPLDEVGRVLKVRGPLLERALESSRRLIEGTAPLLPAWQRYNGIVWSHLDPGSMADEHRRRILVPSGLYGLSAATDVIADYRLTMKVSLGGLGNIARFWRPHLTRVFAATGDAQLISFLPHEHSAAFDLSEERSERLITVRFCRHDGDGVAGHDAKAVKGVVSRLVLEDGVDGIEGFRWKGWRGTIHEGQYLVRAPRTERR